MGIVLPKKRVPFIRSSMKLMGASNEALAIASGLSTCTVAHARTGREIRSELACCICQALHDREFKRDNRGRKAA